VPTIPFFIYYSMFGFQRVGDQVWAFADARGKGFMVGGTAGRTTLNGEGLQHEDGHSHVLASTVPTCVAYDPAYAYEIAVIVQNGIKRMYEDGEDVFFYLTVENENYPQPEMPAGVEEGILKGLYRLKTSTLGPAKVQLLGAGSILNEVLRAQSILEEKYGIPADVYTVTSYNELRRDALHCERWNRLHPTETPKVPYLLQVLGGTEGPIVGASDYMKVVFDQLSPWLPGRLFSLGTDGFGRSESRQKLRRFFEVDAESVASAALYALSREGNYEQEKVKAAIAELGLDADRPDPSLS
jgi:pyruvate dehydrogenase E1 component